jgi:hypothetical protein
MNREEFHLLVLVYVQDRKSSYIARDELRGLSLLITYTLSARRIFQYPAD